MLQRRHHAAYLLSNAILHRKKGCLSIIQRTYTFKGAVKDAFCICYLSARNNDWQYASQIHQTYWIAHLAFWNRNQMLDKLCNCFQQFGIHFPNCPSVMRLLDLKLKISRRHKVFYISSMYRESIYLTGTTILFLLSVQSWEFGASATISYCVLGFRFSFNCTE